MRISDWSSDVCSSDLFAVHLVDEFAGIIAPACRHNFGADQAVTIARALLRRHGIHHPQEWQVLPQRQRIAMLASRQMAEGQIGRASCRERGGQAVWSSGVDGILKKKKKTKKHT